MSLKCYRKLVGDNTNKGLKQVFHYIDMVIRDFEA